MPSISPRALNRATLARQLLIERSTRSAADVVEHLVGLQAQLPLSPYVGLHARIAGFDPMELSDLIANRAAVRIVLMRSTIHLVTSRDCVRIRPVVAAMLERRLFTASPWGRQLADVDLDALVAAGREIVDAEPCTGSALGRRLVERFPEGDAAAMANAIRNFVPLVQIPPRGLWGKAGQPVLTSAEAWLGRSLAKTTKPDALVPRYLAAFGPASVLDMQNWSGLTQLQAAFDRARPKLRTFRTDTGREVFDLPDAPRPPEDLPVPVRFLPEYDNVLLGHADRTRIVTDEQRAYVATRPGGLPGHVLVDGVVRALWHQSKKGAVATLDIKSFTRLTKAERAEVETEGDALLAFLHPAAKDRRVVLGNVT